MYEREDAVIANVIVYKNLLNEIKQLEKKVENMRNDKDIRNIAFGVNMSYISHLKTRLTRDYEGYDHEYMINQLLPLSDSLCSDILNTERDKKLRMNVINYIIKSEKMELFNFKLLSQEEKKYLYDNYNDRLIRFAKQKTFKSYNEFCHQFKDFIDNEEVYQLYRMVKDRKLNAIKDFLRDFGEKLDEETRDQLGAKALMLELIDKSK